MECRGETMEQWEARARSLGIKWFALLPAQMHDGRWVWLDWFVSRARPNMRGGLNWDNYRMGEAIPEVFRPMGPPPPKK